MQLYDPVRYEIRIFLRLWAGNPHSILTPFYSYKARILLKIGENERKGSFMSDFKELCSKLNRGFDDASTKGDEGSYRKLAGIFKEFEGNLREYIQDLTRGEIDAIIEKLEKGGQLTKGELASIRLWIVGDADYYIKLENNFEDWLSELKRLMDEINKINEAEPELEKALQLRAVLQDGNRLLPNIIFYLLQKTRVNSFNRAIAEIDKQGRKILIEMLRDKYTSQEF